MTGMIERVAAALARGEPATDDHRALALAAIETMREPDEAMRAAGAEFFEEGTANQNAFAGAIVYGAMIEAALDSTPK